MPKIYTKTGDKGFTSLTGGKRVKKDDPIVEAYGTVDEVNSYIGLAISKLDIKDLEQLKTMLIEIQTILFYVGAEISTPEEEKVYWPLKEEKIKKLENYIDELDQELPQLTQFILPGGSELGAILHLARAITRRAERLSIISNKDHVITYLNRLSDFLFVAARWVNLKLSHSETSFIPNP